MAAKKVSDAGAQIASWPKHTREVFTWKSQDGAEIEGVLHKPADFQPGRRYPLLVVIHGGPTGVSRPAPYGSATAYPIDAFLAKGALVLEPNYRGSAGYGEKFRSLNVRNLGIGDAWDVLSGIDALVQQGLADRDRVGSMGWSQGGYISAFLTTKHSDRFKAISVGAGISDWMTYYVNTDIHPFTRQYLKATPWDDPKIYADTSPMTYIKQARTPTLIQHGDRTRACRSRTRSSCIRACAIRTCRCSCRSSRASATASTSRRPIAPRCSRTSSGSRATSGISRRDASEVILVGS